MNKKNVKVTKSLSDTAEIVRDSEGKDRLVVIHEEITYTFTNLRPGPVYFIRSNGKEDSFKGNETKKDLNEREREILLNSLDYKNGWLVEEKEVGNSENVNALTDAEIENLIEQNVGKPANIEEVIHKMDSEFAIKRMKDACLRFNLPASIVTLCDYRLQKIEDEFIESQKAPTYSLKNSKSEREI